MVYAIYRPPVARPGGQVGKVLEHGGESFHAPIA